MRGHMLAYPPNDHGAPSSALNSLRHYHTGTNLKRDQSIIDWRDGMQASCLREMLMSAFHPSRTLAT
jgi:hypothetical protein